MNLTEKSNRKRSHSESLDGEPEPKGVYRKPKDKRNNQENVRKSQTDTVKPTEKSNRKKTHSENVSEPDSTEEGECYEVDYSDSSKVSEDGSNKGALGPSEDSEPISYVQFVKRWDRKLDKFHGVLYSEEFRFINLDRITSLREAQNAICQGIQHILDNVSNRVSPGDYVQVHLHSSLFHNSLFSGKLNPKSIDADDFLDWLLNSFKVTEKYRKIKTMWGICRIWSIMVWET
uniref:Uncharacterized protein LOC117359733 n=1 Tax=Geotrypetes seraphini TaxID=260995 RepID=A0A6P8QJL6_GEOSA|nr:uncharacterized protein LOC117359733 [Geotrypetes seraphini]